MEDSEKLTLIGRIYDIQEENNNSDDHSLAAYLALEAIGHVLNGSPEDLSWVVRAGYAGEL